jgi:hypothetical protein
MRKAALVYSPMDSARHTKEARPVATMYEADDKGLGFLGAPEVFSQELFRNLQASRFHTSLSLIVSIA